MEYLLAADARFVLLCCCYTPPAIPPEFTSTPHQFMSNFHFTNSKATTKKTTFTIYISLF